MGQPVPYSYVNQVMRFFDVQAEATSLNNRYERTNFATRHMQLGSSLFLHSMGEHEIHVKLTFAILDGIKLLNRKGEYIDKNGEVVSDKDKAASVIEALVMKDGILQIQDWAKGQVYTTLNKQETLLEGGLDRTKRLIKDRIIRTQGDYTKDTQSQLDRVWWGKLMKQFKKHIPGGMLNRFRGLSDVNKSKQDIAEDEKYYNYAAQTEEYGYYVSFLRYVGQSLKLASYNILQHKEPGVDLWSTMSLHERANIKKTLTELSYIASTILLGMAAAAAADDDDSYAMYMAAYILKRQSADAGLAFYEPGEAWRLTESPMAALAYVNNVGKFLGALTRPWDYDEVYESGLHKDDNKLLVKAKKAMLLNKYEQFSLEFMKKKQELQENKNNLK